MQATLPIKPVTLPKRSRRFMLLSLVLVILLIPFPPAQADQVRELQYWLDDYGIRQAWSMTRGKGVTVAIIDSGVDKNHPALADAVIGGKDFSGFGNEDGTAPVGTAPEHGTLVASMVAARGEGGNDGMIGVAPEANILTASVGFGLEGDVDQQIADAIIWAVDEGADIINLSLSRNSPDWPLSWDTALLYAFKHDVLVIAAAGNRDSGTTMVGAPATMPGVFTVAGVDENQRASQGASTQGVTLAVSAPSEELVGAMPGGGYAIWSGTSGAAPLVSGIAALVYAANPGISADEVAARLINSATPAGDPLLYGQGLVNASAALRAQTGATQSSLQQFQEWIRIYRRADAPEVVEPEEIEGPQIKPIEVKQIDEPGFFEQLTHPVNWRTQVLPTIFLGGFGLIFVIYGISFALYFLIRGQRR